MFKTSPVTSLQVIAHEKSHSTKRVDIEVFFKMRANLRNQAHQAATTASEEVLYRNNQETPPLAIREQNEIKVEYSQRICKTVFLPVAEYCGTNVGNRSAES